MMVYACPIRHYLCVATINVSTSDHGSHHGHLTIALRTQPVAVAIVSMN